MTPRARFSLVLFALSVCASAVLLVHQWQSRLEEVRPVEIYEALQRQFGALRSEDFPGAYREVSSTMQRKFNIEQFAGMVRDECPALLRASRIEFGGVETRDRRAWVQVFFVEREGRVTPCVFSLVLENEGWRVDAARFQRRWPEGHRLGGSEV